MQTLSALALQVAELQEYPKITIKKVIACDKYKCIHISNGTTIASTHVWNMKEMCKSSFWH